MAVARQPIPRVYGTPRTRGAKAWGRSRVLPRPLDISPGPVIAGAAMACIFYLWGCAQVTQANYQKVQLNRQLGMICTQNQALTSSRVKIHSRAAVEEWARLHGMVPSGDVCVYVGGRREGM